MTRDERIRRRLFPGAVPYDTRKGGFVPLPIVLRRAMFLFTSPRSFQIYAYVAMRAGPAGLAWFSMSELAFDLDFRAVAKLKPYIDELVEKGWLLRESSRGLDYFLVQDPMAVLERLRDAGRLPEDRLEAIDELLELLNQRRLSAPDEPQEETPSGQVA